MLKHGLHAEKLVPNTPTIFVQRNRRTNAVEGCWQGRVYDFEYDKKDEQGRKKISFTYRLEKEITCPPEYEGFQVGWHLIEDDLAPEGRFNPPFVSYLLTTNDWQIFETYVSWLLKFLGIHNLYTFER